MTTPLTEHRQLHIVDDEATTSICISDGERYLARSCYIFAGETELRRESRADIERLVAAYNEAPALRAEIDRLRAEVERLTKERTLDHALSVSVDEFFALIERLDPPEPPTDAGQLRVATRCECCGRMMEPGERVGTWWDDDRGEVAVHWGRCPEDAWEVHWETLGDSGIVPARPFEDAVDFGRRLRRRPVVTRVRLVRARAAEARHA